MNWQENQNSSMVERLARYLEVRVRLPVQVQIFLLKFNKEISRQLTRIKKQYLLLCFISEFISKSTYIHIIQNCTEHQNTLICNK